MEEAKWHREEIILSNSIEGIPLRLVSDGLIATDGIADGRLLTVLLVDTSSRPDVEDLIKAHKYFAPGDMKSVWAKLYEERMAVNLILFFEKPVKCTVVLEFDIIKYGGIVDQIVRSEALYLQSAKEGERVSRTLDKEKLLVEVPSKKFQSEWDKMLFKALTSDGQIKGMSKKQAKEYASEVIKKWREFGEMRKKG